MSSNRPNQKRAFADVVSVDAWHAPFEKGRGKAALHADVVFGTAAVGGEVDSPIRFRLSIKRAELVIVIPPTEPLSIDPSSVRRDGPVAPKAKFTQTIESAASMVGGAHLGFAVTPKGATGSGGIEAGARASSSKREKLELAVPVAEHSVTQSKTGDGHYRWIIEMRAGGALSGRAWDALKDPRLKLIDERSNKSLEPSVLLEVRCRAEDLIVEDVEVKDEGVWTKASSRFGVKNRLAAAIAYIKTKLVEGGLEVNNIEDKFGEVTLTQVAAEAKRGN